MLNYEFMHLRVMFGKMTVIQKHKYVKNRDHYTSRRYEEHFFDRGEVHKTYYLSFVSKHLSFMRQSS